MRLVVAVRWLSVRRRLRSVRSVLMRRKAALSREACAPVIRVERSLEILIAGFAGVHQFTNSVADRSHAENGNHHERHTTHAFRVTARTLEARMYPIR